MPLTEEDLKAIGALMELKLQLVLDRMGKRDSEVNSRFDWLIKQNSDREREYLAMSAQLGRHDKQLTAATEQLDRIEKKVDRYSPYFDDLDARVSELEKKTA
jgi:predicted nuclease with TOPRIM domain